MFSATGFVVRPIRILASVIGLVGFAGCYSPAALPEGAPCQRTEQCPDSQQCVLGSCSRSAALPVDAHPTPTSDAGADAMVDAMMVACVPDGLTCASGTPQVFTCGTRCWAKCGDGLVRAAAETRCNTWGGALGEIDNADEDACVNQKVGTTPALWIGMIQGAGAATPDDKWAWNGGGSANYRVWRAVTEPDDGNNGVEIGNEQCTSIRPGGGFDDDNCNTVLPFFCARPLFR